MSRGRSTPLTDAWRKTVAGLLSERGRKADLARHLSAGDPTKIRARTVQIAKVFNQGVTPEAEFLLSVEQWVAQLPERTEPHNQKRGRKT